MGLALIVPLVWCPSNVILFRTDPAGSGPTHYLPADLWQKQNKACKNTDLKQQTTQRPGNYTKTETKQTTRKAVYF